MTDEEKKLQETINSLVETTPIAAHAPHTRTDSVLRCVAYVTAALTVGLIVAVCLLTVKAVGTSDCINLNQGARSAPNTADRLAEDTYNKAQNDLDSAQGDLISRLLAGQPPTGQQLVMLNLAETKTKNAYDAYTKARSADDASRAQNPIGKC